MSTSDGSKIRARARATRWRWPPESLAGGRSPKPAELDEREVILHPLGNLPARHAADGQRISQVLADRHMREEGIALEHHADIALVGRHPRDGGAVNQDVAAGDGLEAGEQHQDRGLA